MHEPSFTHRGLIFELRGICFIALFSQDGWRSWSEAINGSVVVVGVFPYLGIFQAPAYPWFLHRTSVWCVVVGRWGLNRGLFGCEGE